MKTIIFTENSRKKVSNRVLLKSTDEVKTFNKNTNKSGKLASGLNYIISKSKVLIF